MKKKILVCDDDRGILEVMQIMLKSRGLEVQVFIDGKGIVKKVQSFNPDLIFLDIWMPGIDGKEIVMLLKKEEKTKDIPIVVVSALSETAAIAKKIGANGYLGKPFDMQELFSVIDHFVG